MTGEGQRQVRRRGRIKDVGWCASKMGKASGCVVQNSSQTGGGHRSLAWSRLHPAQAEELNRIAANAGHADSFNSKGTPAALTAAFEFRGVLKQIMVAFIIHWP